MEQQCEKCFSIFVIVLKFGEEIKKVVDFIYKYNDAVITAVKWRNKILETRQVQRTGITGGIISGILTGIAYCVPNVWWFCLVSLVPLWNSLLYGRKKKLSLFFYVFSLHVIVLAFLYCLIPELGLSDTAGFFLMSIGLVVAAVILALEYVLVFLPYFLITGYWNSLAKNYAFSWIFFVLSYGMAEWLQEHFFYPAFPWMRLAAIVTPCPLLLQEAAWFGSCFVSMKIVLWNLFLWKMIEWAVLGEKQTKEWRGILIGTAFFAGIFLFDVKLIQEKRIVEENSSLYRTELNRNGEHEKNIENLEDAKNITEIYENREKMEARMKREQEGKKEITVLLVQGNFSGENKWNATMQEIKERYLELSKNNIIEETNFVVWPETAFPVVLSKDSVLIEELVQFCKQYHTNLFVGAFDRTAVGKYNAMYYVTKDGLSKQMYYKQKLAPFGEYMPFEKLVTLFLPEHLQKEAFLAGTKEEAIVFQTEFGKVGTIVCFESLFSEIARNMVKEGAELLLIASNDSWFEHSAALYQHHAQAILRAVETGRYVLRVGNSGITSMISPVGEVLKAVPVKEAVTLVGNVTMLSEQTNYVRYGDSWIVWSYILIGMLSFILSLKMVEKKEKV